MTPHAFESWLSRHRDARAEAGLSRELRPRPPSGDIVDLAGNDYLGLSRDPRVVEAAAEAARTWGAGSGASRLVTGSLDLHAELENALRAFARRPGALVLSTGYQANLAAVASLCDPDTLVVSDAHVHASLVDACRLARHGGLRIVGHNDVDGVRSALRDWFGPQDSPAARGNKRAVVLVESVYSVNGDAAPLVDLAAIVADYDALLIVDEAHALGVSGAGGRGLVHDAGISGRTDVVVTATLSKALGSQGGVVLAAPTVIEHLVNTARPFIYDTGLAPSAAAGALAALRVIEAEPELPARARSLAARLALGLGVDEPAGCVLSVPTPTAAHALAIQAALASEGFAVGCFRPPSTPDGTSRIRLTAKATLRETDLVRVLDRLDHLVRIA